MGMVQFDERSSNFPQPTGLPVIPSIHIPLQVDDRSSRDILYGQSDSPDEAAEPILHNPELEEVHVERVATEAQAITSTSTGQPPNAPDA